MENSYQYFKRDLSWLSFNYRVLLEAEDDTLPIYERIKFLSIYSSNLEEFYEIRVAEHRGVIMKKNYSRRAQLRRKRPWRLSPGRLTASNGTITVFSRKRYCRN